MQWSDFLSLMRDGDGIDTKFFGSFISEDKLGSILVAMANTQGGNIVIGFDKRNYHLLGTFVDESFVSTLVDQYCYPKPDFSVDVCEKNDKRIVIIHVKASPLKPYYFNNKCYVLNPERSSLSILEKDVLQDDRTYSFTPVSSSPDRRLDQGVDSGDVSRVDNDSFGTGHSIQQLEDISTLTDELVELHGKHDQDSLIEPPSSGELADDDVSSDISDVMTMDQQLTMNEVESKPLTQRQEDVLDYLSTHQFIKNKLYRSMYSVSHKTAHLELVDLVRRHLIVSQGSGRSTCYVIDETCKSVTDLVRH